MGERDDYAKKLGKRFLGYLGTVQKLLSTFTTQYQPDEQRGLSM
jgi:hypothetical protein